jgi:hypothetical protein
MGCPISEVIRPSPNEQLRVAHLDQVEQVAPPLQSSLRHQGATFMVHVRWTIQPSAPSLEGSRQRHG